MTAFDGMRESWEPAAPRPVWVVWVKDAVGLVLLGVFVVSVGFLMWALQ